MSCKINEINLRFLQVDGFLTIISPLGELTHIVEHPPVIVSWPF